MARNFGLLLKQRGLVTESRKYLNIAQEADSTGYGANNSRTQRAQQARVNLEASLHIFARCGPVTVKDLWLKICPGCQAPRFCSHECAGLH